MSERERGSATLEAALVYPAVLLLVMLTMNTALWFHARTLAMAAAQEGLRAGRTHGSSPSAGQATAERFIREIGGSFLTHPKVALTRDVDTLEVSVSGQAISLVPLLTLTVTQVARAPIEKWTTSG
ncbi:TadE/TadG family type IV pilus assembly protein [Nonomuraea angiospora]|uniref:Flp pilus assembly protein TadG n=1 Tax=Nonomuraea angiospora TaxID=46172 RepID=A0ABR9LVA7_9ACTN|nr:TadE family protein [Nonomuraea angiospora]MBE1584586.1 Flp pilus assembly protein TadG [Nonomuraea angiospora]